VVTTDHGCRNCREFSISVNRLLKYYPEYAGLPVDTVGTIARALAGRPARESLILFMLHKQDQIAVRCG